MYELIILSLLMRGPVHGYVIAGVINDVIGPFARASNGRIYPLLAKLEEDHFVTVQEETTSDGGRVARSFAITSDGRARFRQLMLDTASSPREYRALFAFKVTAFEQLEREDRVHLILHYLDFARAHVRHLESQSKEMKANATRYGHSSAGGARLTAVFTHLVDTWKGEERWAEELLRDESGKPGKAKPGTKKKGGGE